MNECIFLKSGYCNSEFNKGKECDGLNPNEKCPYDLKKKQESEE